MDETSKPVDVLARCRTCGRTYVEATRIGPARLAVNVSCPVCAEAPSPRRPKKSARGRGRSQKTA